MDEAIERFEYDPNSQAGRAGLVTATLDANGSRTEYAYDTLNRLTRITEADPDGIGPLPSPVTKFVYDAAGNRITTIDAEDSVTQMEYDEMGRRTAMTDSLGQTTRYFYDEVGNRIATVDPLANVRRAVHDARGRIVESIDANGDTTTYRYDLDNNLLRITDPVGNETRFRYDQRNRLTSEIDPLGQRIRNVYDAANQRVRRTDRNGRVSDFEYDDLGRRTGETWLNPDGTVANELAYAYDAVGNLLTAADNASEFSYSFDFRNRVLTKDNAGSPNAPNVVLTYTYDDVGNVLSVTDTVDGQAGATTSYQYDALNRTTRITQSGADVSDKRVALAYNEIGQFAAIDRFGDLAGQDLVVGTRYEYDELNRLVDLRHTDAAADDLAFYEYTYDASNRIRQIISTDGIADYEYDAADQLVRSDYSAATLADESYQYDENGNRVDSHLHGTGYETGAANRLLGDGTYDYAYDAEGNMTRRTETATGDYREFVWDHRNRLSAVSDFAADGTATQVVQFSYDFLNRRITKAVDLNPNDADGPILTHFVNDRDNVIIDLVDEDGAGPQAAAVDQRYLHGPAVDQVLAQDDSAGGVFWHLADHLGSVRDLADTSGRVVNHIIYDAFGQVALQTDPSRASRYGFTGREYDAEIALQYNRARYYDAAVGRFVNEDPIRFDSGDVHLYRYVLNGVLVSVDPYGRTATGASTIGSLSGVVGPTSGTSSGGIGGPICDNEDGGDDDSTAPPEDLTGAY